MTHVSGVGYNKREADIGALMCARGIWVGALSCGVDGAAPEPGLGNAKEQQTTPAAPPICRPGAHCTDLLKIVRGQHTECRTRRIAVRIGYLGHGACRTRSFFGGIAAQLRAQQLRGERRIVPLSLETAKATTTSPFPRVAVLLGAPVSRSWAATSVTGGLAGGVKSATTTSKLYKIEADTA